MTKQKPTREDVMAWKIYAWTWFIAFMLISTVGLIQNHSQKEEISALKANQTEVINCWNETFYEFYEPPKIEYILVINGTGTSVYKQAIVSQNYTIKSIITNQKCEMLK